MNDARQLMICWLLLLDSVCAQTPGEELQSFQNVQVSQYMKSEKLMNVCIIIFVALVVLIVAVVLAKV